MKTSKIAVKIMLGFYIAVMIIANSAALTSLLIAISLIKDQNIKIEYGLLLIVILFLLGFILLRYIYKKMKEELIKYKIE